MLIFSLLLLCTAAASKEWLRGPRVHTGTVHLSFPVALKQGAYEALKAQLYDRADPDSDRFRQWMSRDQVDAVLRAEAKSVAAVSGWISRSTGVTPTLVSGRWLEVKLPVAAAERLLRCVFHDYSHVDGGDFSLRRASSEGYHVPSEIAQHLDGFVGGVSHFPSLRRHKPKPASARGVFVTPSLIKKHYEINSYVSPTGTRSTQAVAQFLDQHYHQSDLDLFFTFYASDQDHSLRKPQVFGPDSGFAGTEASLDIQYQMGVATNTPTQFWSTAGLTSKGDGGQEPFLEFMQNIAKQPDSSVPKIISVSYGDDEPTIGTSYMIRVDAEFVAAGVRGITLFFASGDSGVEGGDGCGPNNQFVPSFPDNSPHVTSVGGTLHSESQTAWSGSGGGFSNFFPQPSYQAAAVSSFLQASQGNLPSPSRYNATGRAYPDIAAFSTSFTVITNLIPSPVDGTSCASPTASAVFSLLNSVLLSSAKNTTLGFIQPWLYKLNGNGFLPITKGCNPGCGSNGFCATSKAKWNPVTGFGEPSFTKLRALL